MANESIKAASKVEKKSKPKEKKPNIFSRIGKYLKEVMNELKRVSWPTRKEMTSYVIAVIVFVVFMGAVIGGLDYVFGLLMKLIVNS